MSTGRVEGLTAVVTGAASGIGLATARLLVEEGAKVAALDRDQPNAEPGFLPVVADVTDQATMDEAARVVTSELGAIDIVVANAGIGSVGTAVDNDDEEWHRVYDVNVVGIVRTVRAFLPRLRQSANGAIVCTSSVVATTGLVQRACYGASKGAVLSLTMAMAADFAADGIRVNCVCPGTVDTPWVGRLLDQADDPTAARANLVARQPVGRLGTAEEIADAIVYLASPRAGYVSGTALAIDGGITGFRVPSR
jgi:2-keto-3-deoxy-L-fuconate dehydrogenase